MYDYVLQILDSLIELILPLIGLRILFDLMRDLLFARH